MKRINIILMLTVGVVLLTEVHAQNPREIILKMEENTRGNSSYVEMTMTTVRPRYTRETSFTAWTKGEDYSLIFVTAPARDKGVGFLKRMKEIWNYVPSIDRTIKLPPSMMSQSWMGSDFTNDDLVRESSTVDDYTHRIMGEEEIDGLNCWKIELIPHPESSVVFSKVLIWISKELYLHMKSENYDERNQLVSTLLMSEVRNMGGREIPTRMEMIPHDKTNHRTIITYENARFDFPVEESFFSTQNLRNFDAIKTQ
jgi:hypothetical protein